MVDLHSHVLPGMDDGSRSVEESLQMLRASAEQGVDLMAATPHFYPAEENIEQFLGRRESAFRQLEKAWQAGLPRLLPGAEIYYFEGMNHVQALNDLQIGGTGLLLIEMPFSRWSRRMVEDVMTVHARPHIQVVLAHIERYLPFRNAEALDALRDSGVLMQSNAEFFLHWRTRHKALRMLRRGEIDFLGSDCHNMSSRAPNLGAAAAAGGSGIQTAEDTLRRFLPEREAKL